MADKRRVVQPMRYSPYSDRTRKPDEPQEIPITVRGARIQNHSATLEELQQSHCIKNEMTVDSDLHDPNDTGRQLTFYTYTFLMFQRCSSMT